MNQKRQRGTNVWFSPSAKLLLCCIVVIYVVCMTTMTVLLEQTKPSIPFTVAPNTTPIFQKQEGSGNRTVSFEKEQFEKLEETARDGAFVYLTNEQHIDRRQRVSCPGIFHSLTSLRRYFPKSESFPSLEVVILHDEPLTNSTRDAISLASPFPVIFRAVEFKESDKTPSNLSLPHVKYRQMCSFWFHDIFELDFLPDYVMRLDTDTCITSKMPMNPFQYMQNNGVDYMWHSTFPERDEVIQGLYEFVAETTDSNGDRPLRLWNGSNARTDVFSTNLEWYYLPAFRRQGLLEWKEKVERHGGIFLSRWGDAPLRSVAVTTFFGNRVARFCSFSYNHSGWDPYRACDENAGKRVTDEFGWKVT